MRVLLTNDDGIHAPGIVALHAALLGGASPIASDVMTVAPLTVQSAAGHGITFRQPLITKTVRINPAMEGVAVDGRPADCVKVALSVLWPERFGAGSRPDLVVSGMNMGANVGINVIYSGTVAAALEAAFLGVPSIAVSLHHGTGAPLYSLAAERAALVMRRVLAAGLRAHECININVPRTETPGPQPEAVVCPMNTHGLVDAYQRNVNPLGEVYYWSAGTPMEFHQTEPESDVQQVGERRITVTPLRFDLTDHATLGRWRTALA